MSGALTEAEIGKILREKWKTQPRGYHPPTPPRVARKRKLKMRFGHDIDREIARTQEKLDLLNEIKAASK